MGKSLGKMLIYAWGGAILFYSILSIAFDLLSSGNGVSHLNALLFIVVFIAVLIGTILWWLTIRLMTGKWPQIYDGSNDDIVSIRRDISEEAKEIGMINKRLAKLEEQNEQKGKAKRGGTTQKTKRAN